MPGLSISSIFRSLRADDFVGNHQPLMPSQQAQFPSSIPHILAPAQFFPNGVEKGNVLQLNQSDRKIIFPHGQLVLGVDEFETRIEGTYKILPAAFYFKRDH